MAEKLNLKSNLNAGRIREKGMFRFILEVGIIRFAIPVTILSKIIFYLLNYGWTMPNIGETLSELNIIRFIGEVLFEGIFFGSIVWYWGKKEDYPN
jgi:hypothetical protein